MKWLNTYILSVFHFSPPLAYGPVLVKSGPMSPIRGFGVCLARQDAAEFISKAMEGTLKKKEKEEMPMKK
jgi:hypothetical protein